MCKLLQVRKAVVVWLAGCTATARLHHMTDHPKTAAIFGKKSLYTALEKNLPAKSFPKLSYRAQELLHHQTPYTSLKMRPLTETETQTLFAKLANYTGTSLKNLIAPLDNGPNADRYVFRIQQSRCYYVRLSLANLATSVAKDKLLSLGTCLGTSPFLPNILPLLIQF